MNIDFDKGQGLVPAIIQHAQSRQVLMLGYMNSEALRKTRETGLVTFYSRSRGELWTKGQTSGNMLKLVEILTDCDNDTLLVKVLPTGPVCHTGAHNCFTDREEGFLHVLEGIILERHRQMPKDSYTTRLFAEGINKIAQKVGEEAVELVIEAKDDNPERFRDEAADLLYHLLVLLRQKRVSLSEIEEVLVRRHK